MSPKMRLKAFTYKHKTPGTLLLELQEENIERVIDIRRRDVNRYNSSPHFFPREIGIFLIKNGVGYTLLPALGNYGYAETAGEYFKNLHGSAINELIGVLSNTQGNVALICYCPKDQQIAGDCHAVWLINKLQALGSEENPKGREVNLDDFFIRKEVEA